MRTAVVDRPIDTEALLREIAAPQHGAAVLFVGTVREINDGRPVTGIDYSAYDAMAIRELAAIAGEAEERFRGCAAIVEHRIGTLSVGEASVAIVTAHAHRDEAYQANRFIIEELKRRLPVWKREHYTDGSRSWVNQSDEPVSDQGAEAGR